MLLNISLCMLLNISALKRSYIYIYIYIHMYSYTMCKNQTEDEIHVLFFCTGTTTHVQYS